MSRIGVLLVFINESFPRVSGDEPSMLAIPWLSPRFSPRERG